MSFSGPVLILKKGQEITIEEKTAESLVRSGHVEYILPPSQKKIFTAKKPILVNAPVIKGNDKTKNKTTLTNKKSDENTDTGTDNRRNKRTRNNRRGKTAPKSKRK